MNTSRSFYRIDEVQLDSSEGLDFIPKKILDSNANEVIQFIMEERFYMGCVLGLDPETIKTQLISSKKPNIKLLQKPQTTPELSGLFVLQFAINQFKGKNNTFSESSLPNYQQAVFEKIMKKLSEKEKN